MFIFCSLPGAIASRVSKTGSLMLGFVYVRASACLSTGLWAGEDENAVHSLRSDRYCVSLIDTDQSRNTGKYYDS